MMTAEQIISSNKTALETMFGFSAKAFANVEKIVELNVATAKAALAESAEHAKAAVSVKDAQEFMALQAALIQPSAEKIAAYSRTVYEITSGATADLGKNIEEQSAEAQKKFMSLVDTAAKNAPAGSEAAVSMVKSAVTAANSAFETVQKSVKQATELAEKNIAAATETAMKATTAATATATAAKKR